MNTRLVYIFPAVTFGKFTPYPLTTKQAKQAGWKKDASCSGMALNKCSCLNFSNVRCSSFLSSWFQPRFISAVFLSYCLSMVLFGFALLRKPLPRRRVQPECLMTIPHLVPRSPYKHQQDLGSSLDHYAISPQFEI